MAQISVVMPAFNAAATIARAVRSILDQTLRDIELIVADDGSTDETIGIVHSIRDPRMRLIESDHYGVADATNAATECATAPLIARMDADDFSYPHRLQRQVQLLQQQQLDVVGSQVRIVDQAGDPVDSLRRYEQWINHETLDCDSIAALRFVELPLVNPTILARRRYFELGFQNNDRPEDYDLLLRAAAAGMRFGKVPEVLLDWIDSSTRLTRSDGRYSADAFMRCRRAHLRSGPLCGVAEVDLWGMGQTGKPWYRWLREENFAVRHVYDIDDRKVGQTIHGTTVMHPSSMPPADGVPLLIAVGAAGARETIRPQIKARGYVSGRDAWFVA